MPGTAQRCPQAAVALLACALALLLMAPMDAASQLAVAAVLLLALRLLGQVSREYDALLVYARVAAVVLGISISVRYLLWRTFYTLEPRDLASMTGALLLYAAELYSVIVYITSSLVSAAPLRRPQLGLDAYPETALPTVDVLVPSYSESPEMLEVTLRAARQLQYPQDRLRVYLLDDGATEARRLDPATRPAARRRRAALQALCERVGATYLSRARNDDAKAGNINAALARTGGDLVAILDADHVPGAAFLSRTVPWLLRDEQVFLVQTPHHMANPDPAERNALGAFTRMPSENDMFYGIVQRGLDFWDATFFCGSAAVLRRSHLEAIGGLAGETVTEDAETSLHLHARGYRSVYVDEPLITGLAPETFQSFIRQRLRWSQGMTQILLLHRPHRLPGLRWYQRLGYLSAITFWLFPFARLLFLLLPLSYLVFGLQIYDASFTEILAYTLPHVIGVFLVADILHGRTRWPLVSELYELLQCLFTVRAVARILRQPRSARFDVTPKGEQLGTATRSPLASAFYPLFLLLLAGAGAGVWRWFAEPLSRELTAVVMVWNLFNLVLVIGALGVLAELRQQRGAPRVPAGDAVLLEDGDGRRYPATLEDLSTGGCALRRSDRTGHAGEPVAICFWQDAAPPLRIPVRRVSGDGAATPLRVSFEPATERERQAVVALSAGDHRRRAMLQRRRQRPLGYRQALLAIVGAGTGAALRHGRLLLRDLRLSVTRRAHATG